MRLANFDFITTRLESRWWSCPFNINGLGVTMLCCIALRELKIRITVTRQCYRVRPSVKTKLLFHTLQSFITPASNTFCTFFTRAFLLDDLNNLMQIILAFSNKKLRSSVRLTGWFTRSAAKSIYVGLSVSICTSIFIEFTKCLWDKFVLFLKLVVQSVVCGQTVEWPVFLSQTVF